MWEWEERKTFSEEEEKARYLPAPQKIRGETCHLSNPSSTCDARDSEGLGADSLLAEKAAWRTWSNGDRGPYVEPCSWGRSPYPGPTRALRKEQVASVCLLRRGYSETLFLFHFTTHKMRATARERLTHRNEQELFHNDCRVEVQPYNKCVRGRRKFHSSHHPLSYSQVHETLRRSSFSQWPPSTSAKTTCRSSS